MRMNDAFPSKYLKAEDLEEGDLIVKIKEAQFEEFTDQRTKRPDNKPVLYFSGEVKPLVLNKTNYKTITQLLGSDDTDDWTGRKIALYATEVESFGEVTLGIRVRLKAPATAKTTAESESQARRDALKTKVTDEDLDDSAPPF